MAASDFRRRLKRVPSPGSALKSVVVGAYPDVVGGYGGSVTPWPAGAQFDYGRVVGDISNNSVVSIALAWIRRQIAQGRIVVGREANGKYVESKNHPLTCQPRGSRPRGILRRPNPWDSWRATLGGTSDSLAIDGNAYWIKARNGLLDSSGRGEVTELYWAPNHCITVEPETEPGLILSDGPIRRYGYSIGGWQRWYAPSEVIHFRNGRDPICRYMGLSDLKRQLRNIGSIEFAEKYTGAVLRHAHAGKALAPKGVTGDIVEDSPEEREMNALARQAREGASGENAGRITKLSYPVEVIDLGMGPEDMGLDRIVDRPEAYILASLGPNAMTLNLPSSRDLTTYANKAEARRESYENGVIPPQDLIAEEIESQLLHLDFASFGADSCWWDRKDVEALREDANERATRVVALRGGPIISENEGRAEMGLPPVEGGNITPGDLINLESRLMSHVEVLMKGGMDRDAAEERLAQIAEDEELLAELTGGLEMEEETTEEEQEEGQPIDEEEAPEPEDGGEE